MIIEMKVLSSQTLYEEVLPLLERLGYKRVPGMGWADPDSDGEYQGFYFTYDGAEPVSLEDFHQTFRDVEKAIMESTAPMVHISILPDKK